MKKDETTVKSVRMKSNLIQKIEKLAKTQNRNFSNMVETLLLDKIDVRQEARA